MIQYFISQCLDNVVTDTFIVILMFIYAIIWVATKGDDEK